MFDELIVYVLRKNDDLPKLAFKAIEFGVEGEVFEREVEDGKFVLDVLMKNGSLRDEGIRTIKRSN